MRICNPRAYGAAGDGTTLDTQALQAAIDDCAAHGGGQVVLAEGRFLSGMIRLKSGVDLHIERDAVLLGSTDAQDFPDIETDFWRTEYAPRFNRRCFLYAEGCEDIAVTGRGRIDCQGEAYVLPMTEEEMALRPNMSFTRKPFPLPEGETLDEAVTMVGAYPHPLDPRSTSLAPARVAFFIGCRNVLVEDVTMCNQPAGWSYWVCDCDNVRFHRAQILAHVDRPNNDGIHINCCRNVNISDCNITCGDDCIVVRAYSAPLHRTAACERVTATNCNLTSHACAVRVGWINDGVMRDCVFSGLNITESCSGLTMYLPGNPASARMSDQGNESTLIENILFSNITIDRHYGAPVTVHIADGNLCTAVRNISFCNVHARSAQMPVILGRRDCPVQNVCFDNCHFAHMRYEDMHTRFADRYRKLGRACNPPRFEHVENLVLNNTVFSVM